MVALRNIEDRFNRRLKYPYVILTEANITQATQEKINWITEGRATVGTVGLKTFTLQLLILRVLRTSRFTVRHVGNPGISG